MSPLDLHVLSTPPAFVLSQDQTLSFNPVISLTGSTSQVSTHSELLSYFCVISSVSFSRFSAVPAVSRASQLVYLIKLPVESQHLFFDFFDFFAIFSFLRTHTIPLFRSVHNIPNITSFSHEFHPQLAPLTFWSINFHKIRREKSLPLYIGIFRALSAIRPCQPARGMLQ